MLRNDEALSTTWSDQPGCLPRVNLQLPHKDHFNYTVQTSLKSPFFPFIYLRERHINWLFTVFLSHFQKTHAEEGEKGKGKAVNASLLKRRQTCRHESSWTFLEEGMTERGCNAAGTGVLLWDGSSGSGQLWQQCTAWAGGHRGTLPWHSSTALTTTLPLPPAHGPGWARPVLLCSAGHPALLRQMRGSSFSRGAIQFTCILCCIIQE